MLPTNFNYIDVVPSVPRILSPPPTPTLRSPPPRPDRLSLRLRSNSGLRMHTNDAALRQYTDYESSGQYSPRKATYGSSLLESRHENMDDVLSPRSMQLGSRQSMPHVSGGLVSALPFLDFLGKEAFQMAMECAPILRHMTKYCEDQGCEENVDFLIKVSDGSTCMVPRPV